MKSVIIISLLIFTICACGSNKTALRAELQEVEAEMIQLSTSARQYQKQMNQADDQSLLGSFAAGFGAVSGYIDLTGEGIGSVVQSSRDHNASRDALEQLSQRYDALAQRRDRLLQKLN